MVDYKTLVSAPVQLKRLIDTKPLKVIILVVLFGLGLIPRTLPFSSTFLTYDEIPIGRWTSQMTQALLTGDWPGTINNAYPAVTLMWIEAVQVEAVKLIPALSSVTPAQMLSDSDKDVFASLPRRRLALAMINAMIILAAYGLLRRLYHEYVAVLATVLMALDPFLLTQARVFRTEGLTTGLMLLSALTILLYAKNGARRWLVVSGLLGGLATLTKITSLYLLPFTALTLLAWPILSGRRDMKSLILGVIRGLAGWSLVMVITGVVLWPALWSSPLEAFNILSTYLQGAGADVNKVWGPGGSFFRGISVTSDPGVSFYLWLLAYRTTPLIWLGLLAALGGGLTLVFSLLRKRGRQPVFSAFPSSPAVLLILAYAVFFFIAMSLGAAKVDRYLMPIFPALVILAAVGFGWITEVLPALPSGASLKKWSIGAALFLGSAWLSLPHHPYYFTYWNPLLGGSRGAVTMVPVGAGEGVDVLIDYLNALPNARTLSVSSTGIHQNISVAFEGTYLKESSFLDSDYFVTTISSRQKGTPLTNIQLLIPDLELVSNFRRDGVEYAELYRMPSGLHYAGQWLGAHGWFSGYRLSADKASAGDRLEVTLFWQNGEQGWTLEDSEFVVKLLDETGQVQQIAPVQIKPDLEAYRPRPNQVLALTALLDLPPELPVGIYRLEIGLRLKATGEETWQFSLAEASNTIIVDQGVEADRADTLSIQHVLDQAAGPTGLTLRGYDVLTGSRPRLKLYWQANRVVAENYVLKLSLLDRQGQAATGWSQMLSPEIHPLTDWQPGETVAVVWPLETAAGLNASGFQPIVSLWPAEGQVSEPLAEINLLPLPADFTLAPVELNVPHRLSQVTFGQDLDLLGYELQGKGNANNGVLQVTLHWLNRQPLEPVEAEVEVLDQAGRVIGRQSLAVAGPGHALTWQSVSYYELALPALPASLSIRARPVGGNQWYRVQSPDQPGRDQVVIDDVLAKVAVVSNE